MNDGKKTNIIILSLAAVAIVLLVQCISYNGRMEALASRISELQNTLNNSSEQLYGRLTGYVDAAIQQSVSQVETASVVYDGFDAAAKTVRVHLSFRLKDTQKDAKINVLSRAADNSAEAGGSFEAVTANGVDFTCDFPLSYTNDYLLDIYQTDATGNNRKLNTQSVPVNILSEFSNRTTLPTRGLSLRAEGVDVNVGLENRTFGQKSFGVKIVTLILLADGREIARRDVTDRSIINAEAIERYSLMVAAGEPNIKGQLPPNMVLGKMQTDPESVERGYYIETFTNGQISRDSNAGKPEPQYGYAVQVTYEDGTVFKIE